MKKEIYFGNWSTKQNVMDRFQISEDDLKGCNIIYADYACKSYDGWCIVLFRKNRKLYEVIGSHCSCYGLEGQWEPQETTVAALRVSNPDIAKKLFGDKE